MALVRSIVALLLILIVAATTVDAQLLKKLKNATDKALDVAEEVDRYTFSEDEEIELGKAISQRIRTRYGVEQDQDATRYLSLVGWTVAAESGRKNLPWTWIILDSSAVNAFAAPGGFIHVTRGALAIMQSEAELAGVLAHEVGHVTDKHTLKGVQKSMGMELAQNQAAFAAGSDLFNKVADQASRAVVAGFSQAEELEADQVGIQFSRQAGYDPGGLAWFLKSLATLTASSDSESSLFRSHPDTVERIEKANQQIARENLEGGVWLEERYGAAVSYQVASASSGGPAVEGALGVAGADESESSETENAATQEDSDETDEDRGGRFSLSQLATDAFDIGSEEGSSEVTGAGAGRAVGEEDDEAEEGSKNSQIVEVEITPEELTAFRKEGGLQ